MSGPVEHTSWKQVLAGRTAREWIEAALGTVSFLALFAVLWVVSPS